MTTPDPTGATPAATVIIGRNSPDGLEVLAIERAKGMGFAGGAVAFPGGKVDATDQADHDVFIGFEGLDPDDATARISAAREAFEESGILLSDGPPVDPELEAKLRTASDTHQISFGDLLAQIGHTLRADRLIPFARWLPPHGLHKRFDTRFYIAAQPEGAVMRADGHEAVRARWITPKQLLEFADSGRISVLFPTKCNIARLGQFETIEELLADQTPPPFIQPAMQDDGWLTIPENIGYPYTRERLETVRRQ